MAKTTSSTTTEKGKKAVASAAKKKTKSAKNDKPTKKPAAAADTKNKPRSETFVVCPYTDQKVWIAKATSKDLRIYSSSNNKKKNDANAKASDIHKSGHKKRLWTISSSQIRHDHYEDVCQAISLYEQNLLPSSGGRSWEVSVKLSEPNGRVLFRSWKGQMELACLPHMLDRIPVPPIWPGKRGQSADDYQAMQGADADHTDYIQNLMEREISTLSQVAWDVLRTKYDHPVPSINLKWKSPDAKSFTSRKSAWEHAKFLSQQEVTIDRNIYGIGASGKLLKEFVPTNKTTIEVGKLRFVRDGLWVVGQESAWQDDRLEKLQQQEEERQEAEDSDCKVYTTGLQLYVASQRESYRDEQNIKAEENSTKRLTLTQADKALRQTWKYLSPQEQELWNKKVQELFGDDDSSSSTAASEEEKDNKDGDEEEEVCYITHLVYFVQQRRQTYRYERQMEMGMENNNGKFTLTQADRELRKQWKEMDEKQQDDWIAKLEKMEEEEEVKSVGEVKKSSTTASSTCDDNDEEEGQQNTPVRESDDKDQETQKLDVTDTNEMNAVSTESSPASNGRKMEIPDVTAEMKLDEGEDKSAGEEVAKSTTATASSTCDEGEAQKAAEECIKKDQAEKPDHDTNKMNAISSNESSPVYNERNTKMSDVTAEIKLEEENTSAGEVTKSGTANSSSCDEEQVPKAVKESDGKDQGEELDDNTNKMNVVSKPSAVLSNEQNTKIPDVTPSIQTEVIQIQRSEVKKEDCSEVEYGPDHITMEIEEEKKTDDDVKPAASANKDTIKKRIIVDSSEVDNIVNKFLSNNTASTKSTIKKQTKKSKSKQGTQKWCLKQKQIDQCHDACMEHYETVMRTVKARDLAKELADGFDVLRERGHGRFDMELSAFETPAFDFLNNFDQTPWMPIVRAVLGDDIVLIHKGCFLSLPGADTQVYHQDGVHLTTQSQRPCHAINVFVPLVDLHSRNGPTEFVLGSHVLGHEGYDRDFLDTPKPTAGTPVIFDYRLGHRGLGNSSHHCRPVVYCTYARAVDGKEFRDSVNFSRKRYHKIGDMSAKPLSREERKNKRKRSIESLEKEQVEKAKALSVVENGVSSEAKELPIVEDGVSNEAKELSVVKDGVNEAKELPIVEDGVSNEANELSTVEDGVSNEAEVSAVENGVSRAFL